MLVLSRKKNESIRIGTKVVVTVIEIRGDKVRLGISAPKSIPVHRSEVFEVIEAAGGFEHPAISVYQANQLFNAAKQLVQDDSAGILDTESLEILRELIAELKEQNKPVLSEPPSEEPESPNGGGRVAV